MNVPLDEIRKAVEKVKTDQPFPWQFAGNREDLIDANDNLIIEGEVWGESACKIIENAPAWIRALLDENELLRQQRDKVLREWNESINTSQSLIETIESMKAEKPEASHG